MYVCVCERESECASESERVSIGVGVLHRSKCPFTRKTRVELGELAGESALNHLYYYGKKKKKGQKENWVLSDGQMCV